MKTRLCSAPIPRFLMLILALILTQVCIGQIGAKTQGSLTGQWQNDELGRSIKLQFNINGQGIFDGESFVYSTTGNQITFQIAGTTTIYTYSVQGDELILSGGDLDGPISFVRSGTAVAQTDSAPANKAAQSQQNTSTEIPTGLIGTWSGNGESFEFKENGECIYLGQSFPYKLSELAITLVTPQGDLVLEYTLDGNQLILGMFSANGYSTATYTRTTSIATQSTQSASQQNVPLELCGQWCWIDVNSYNQGSSMSSRCITLNANGTYTYSSESSRSVNTPDYSGGTASQGSDQGTWYVQGDRIYYSSPTNGQGSYRLEKRNHPKNVNDPMIVLDGEAYVTATQRQPWR